MKNNFDLNFCEEGWYARPLLLAFDKIYYGRDDWLVLDEYKWNTV